MSRFVVAAAKGRRREGSLSLDIRVQALLAGRAGTVFDLTDNATRFQDAAGTIPITANGQPVANVKSKWGTLVYGFDTVTSTRWPAAAADGLAFNGVDDSLQGIAANLGFMRNTAKITAGVKFAPADVVASGTVFYFSRNGSSSQNWLDLLQSTNDLRFLTRRVQADGSAIFTTTNTLANGVPAVALLEADFTGTGRMECRQDGIQLAGAALAGTLGNTEDGDSNQATLGAVNSTTSRFNGTISKLFLARFALTPSERTIVEEWLAEA